MEPQMEKDVPASAPMANAGQATASAGASVVTADNFNRAESHNYFRRTIAGAGGVGRLFRRRELEPIDHQIVIRANRDTLYTAGVFDLDASPVTITLPDTGKRFASMIVIDEDQYALGTFYAPGTFTVSRDQVATRYVLIGIRIFVDPTDLADLERVHALQDQIKSDQKSAGSFDAPKWDAESQKKVRDALLVLAATLPDTRGMFGPKDRVDPVRHLVGSATGWGGNAVEDALYLTVVPPKNDGKTNYKLVIRGEVPVDAFWSISVYGADGFFHRNDREAYTLNNLSAKKDADGSVTIQFGGCDGKIANCLPIAPGWNYWVRLYRPRPEILSGNYVFPSLEPVAEKASTARPVRDAEEGTQAQVQL
jgi:hypothetical protein